MLHVGILPHHKSWGDFLANLGWVVVDEAHTYRGVFGSHVANVLRRLRRVAAPLRRRAALRARVGHDRQPARARRAAWSASRSAWSTPTARPRAARRIAMWNPPVHRPAIDDPPLGALGGRGAPGRPGRRGAAHDLLPSQPPRHRADPALHPDAARGARPAASSRSGSPPTGPATRPQQRREIEARLAGGRPARRRRHGRARARDRHRRARRRDLRDLPGHRRQPAADVGARRAGAREGLALYVAGEDALDQFFCRHPDEFLERPVEAAILDHENDRIQLAHLLAAAYEIAALASPTTEVLGDALAGARRGAGRPRRAPARPRGPLPAARPALPGRRDLAALGLAGLGRDRRAATRASCSGRSRRSGRSRPCTPAPSTCTWGAPTRSASSTSRSRRAVVDAFDGDWYTQPKKETEVFIEGWWPSAVTSPAVRAQLRRGVGHRAGDRLPAQAPDGPRGDRHGRARPAGDQLPDAGALVRARRTSSPARSAAARRPARRAARHRARRRSRCCRCSRCATAGTSAACRPTSTSRPAGRRSSSTTATPAGSASPGAASSSSSACVADAATAGRRVPVRRRLPLVRAEPEVRQPERAPPQGGSAGADGGDARRSAQAGRVRMTRRAQISVIGKGTPDRRRRALAPRRSVGAWREAGAVVVCGGLGGVMEAASRGAASAGGDRHRSRSRRPTTADANPYCTHVVATGIGPCAQPRGRRRPAMR